MMNKTRFRILVFLMSISLIGIILVQLYWINSSFQKNDDQFKHHALVVLSNVSEKLNNKEMVDFYTSYKKFKDSTGKFYTYSRCVDMIECISNISFNNR